MKIYVQILRMGFLLLSCVSGDQTHITRLGSKYICSWSQSAKSLIQYSMKTQGIEHFNPSSFVKACYIPVGNWTNGHSDHLMYYTDGISLLSDVVLQFPSLSFFNVLGIL